jgi:hypothetical protein
MRDREIFAPAEVGGQRLPAHETGTTTRETLPRSRSAPATSLAWTGARLDLDQFKDAYTESGQVMVGPMAFLMVGSVAVGLK